MNLKVAITAMHPRLPWELVEDPLGHTVGITILRGFTENYKGWTYAHDFISVSTANQAYSLARHNVSSAKPKHIRCHFVNLLKPKTYTSFNIQKFYVLPHTLYLCVLCGSQNKQRLFLYTALICRFL